MSYIILIIELSSGINDPIDDVGMNLSPMEFELNYGFKKEVLNNLSQTNKLLNISPDNTVNRDMPFVVDQVKNISLKETQPR